MRAFVAKIALALVPVAVMIVTNVIYDPSHLLREGPERHIADRLVSGQPVAGVVNFDERRTLWYVLQRQSAPTDVVVLGSSRGMQVSAHAFPEQTFFNACVSAAAIEDLIAIAGEYARRDLLPRTFVLALDPSFLNRMHHHDGWRVMEDGYDEVMREAGLPPASPQPPSFDRLAVMLSPAYFQQALREIKARRSLSLAVMDEADGDQLGMLRSDGSRVYPRSVRERTPAQVDGLAVSSASDIRRDPETAAFTELDAFAMRRFEALLGFVARRGTHVAFLLPPYHPATVRLLRDAGVFTSFDMAERYYRDVAARFRIPIAGSFDPASTGCDATEFYDGHHPRESCLGRIVRMLTRASPGI